MAALVTATFGTEARRGGFLVAGSGLTAAGLAALSAAPGLTAAAVASAGIGGGLVLFLSTGQSTLQLAAGDTARGRVMALWAMTLSFSAPLGHVVAGAMAVRVGVTAVLAGMAAGATLVVAAVVGLTLSRSWVVVEPAPPVGDDGPAEE